MKIFGISGTLASGKDTIAQMLEEHYGFMHISTSDMLRAEKKRTFGDSPKALLLRNDPFANNLRATRGAGVLVEIAKEEYDRNSSKFPKGLVISGIRSIGEAEKVKELGGEIIFVDADSRTRYGRIASRARDINDHSVTYDEFMAMEKSESPDGNSDKTVQNLPELKKVADIQLLNNGHDIEAFKSEAIKHLK